MMTMGTFLQKIEPLLLQNSICYAFILRTPPKAYIDEYIHLMSMVLRYDQLFMEDKVQTRKCYFGMITSQAFFFHNSPSFTEDPTQTLINELTFGTFTPVHDEKNVFPSLYQMVPNEIHQYTGIIQLLQHFGWIWIGIMAVDDDYGDMFLQNIEPLLLQNSICYAFILRTPPKAYIEEYIHLMSMVLRYDQLFMEDKVKVH
ncbi:hypothetical protein E2320_003002, partial [Naja naja]